MTHFSPPESIVSILGAGAWGTALAVHLASAGSFNEIILWMRQPEEAERLNEERVNTRYLPDIAFPSSLRCTADLSQAMSASLLILAVPSQASFSLREQLERYVERPPLLLLSKGFDVSTEGECPRLLFESWSNWSSPVMVLSGPNFAREIALGLPAASTLAAESLAIAEHWVKQLHTSTLRLYASDDRAGVAIGGAVKNVLAIAAGLSDGLNLGHNARAALITRGLAELMTLTRSLGGKPETLFGLSGLGDLLLTCTGDSSRNRQVGLQLATGASLEVILNDLGHVAEGVYAAKAVVQLADNYKCDMPVCRAVLAVLDGKLSPASAVEQLLARSPKPEWQLPVTSLTSML
ncbi:MAG: NAD(P)H-dependent glycerol-3-phosphate dehydrogenase [Pseudomonadota bacterium]